MFHFARFDIAMLRHYLGVACAPVYCTKIASKLARTYTDRHGLKDLCRELLGHRPRKGEQSSDWGAAELSETQLRYAARDVLYLHALRERLDAMLEREGRATWPPPASTSCRCAPSSTWPAGPSTTSSPTEPHRADSPRPTVPR